MEGGLAVFDVFFSRRSRFLSLGDCVSGRVYPSRVIWGFFFVFFELGAVFTLKKVWNLG